MLRCSAISSDWRSACLKHHLKSSQHFSTNPWHWKNGKIMKLFLVKWGYPQAPGHHPFSGFPSPKPSSSWGTPMDTVNSPTKTLGRATQSLPSSLATTCTVRLRLRVPAPQLAEQACEGQRRGGEVLGANHGRTHWRLWNYQASSSHPPFIHFTPPKQRKPMVFWTGNFQIIGTMQWAV